MSSINTAGLFGSAAAAAHGLRPLPHSRSGDGERKATHAYWGSDSRCLPPRYLRQETRNRVRPLSPVVRSCGRRGDRRSPSTRDDPGADVALSLTRPLRLPRIRRTLDPKNVNASRERGGKEEEKKKKKKKRRPRRFSLRASAGAQIRKHCAPQLIGSVAQEEVQVKRRTLD